SPEDGILNSAILHFPPGTNSLVEVVINHGTVRILPTPATGGGTVTGIALDGTTQSFSINKHVGKGDPLEVVITNHDDAESHTISVILLIEKKLTYAGA
ncbi:unnamed protein product, partial [marine sediment metagenome]